MILTGKLFISLQNDLNILCGLNNHILSVFLCNICIILRYVVTQYACYKTHPTHTEVSTRKALVRSKYECGKSYGESHHHIQTKLDTSKNILIFSYLFNLFSLLFLGSGITVQKWKSYLRRFIACYKSRVINKYDSRSSICLLLFITKR